MEGIVMRNRPVYDVVALLARCGVGVVFLAHGWGKIQVGVTATGRNLDAMGTPVPTAAAVYATFVELLGGAALILGLALPVVGTLLFLDMAGAFVFVHAKHGIFLVDKGNVHNGFELVLVLGLAALVFAAGGGGRLTLDHRLFGQGGRRSVPPPAEHPALAAPGERTAPSGEQPDPPASKGRAVTPGPGARTAAPEAGEAPPVRPRLAAEMVTGTSRDVIVAGKKQEPPAGDTTPMKTRKKAPRSGS
jgi:putative oxidoreductase